MVGQFSEFLRIGSGSVQDWFRIISKIEGTGSGFLRVGSGSVQNCQGLVLDFIGSFQDCEGSI